MSTSFITLAQLEALYGAPQVAVSAETQAAAQAIIDSINDSVEGRVRSGYAHLGYPNAWTADIPTQAVSMLRRPAAALAMQLLFGSGVSKEMAEAAAQAERSLDAIALGRVALQPLPAVVDDPGTPDDESETGAACGAAPRLMGRAQLGGC